jgi:8-oxo-dGTP pyrophosphatase MutT (NUDIX family)
MMNRKEYQNGLPKKRMSAGMLLFDKKGRLLILQPRYKKTWEIPGGTVEANESPRRAAIREVDEELGLSCEPSRLLAVDFSDENETRTESMNFIFLGPALTAKEIAAIRLPKGELTSYKFLPPKKAVRFLNRKLRRRILGCLKVMDKKLTLYMEEQQPI